MMNDDDAKLTAEQAHERMQWHVARARELAAIYGRHVAQVEQQRDSRETLAKVEKRGRAMERAIAEKMAAGCDFTAAATTYCPY